MKNTFVRIVLAALLLMGCGVQAVMADGGPFPMCFPPEVCRQKAVFHIAGFRDSLPQEQQSRTSH